MARVFHHLSILFFFTATALTWMLMVIIATPFRLFEPRPWWYGPVCWTALFSVPSLLLIVFTWRVVRDVRAATRRANGRCATCGYDLCASPERCPECGTAVT